MAVIGTLLNLSLSAALVIISGAFAGLTIALMTQDEIYLKVIAAAGEAIDQQNASKIIALLSQEKHWILVTLLLGNCIASEALPVILDRIVHGGLLAVLGSVTLIVIFSEIIPQSIFARYSLKIGAYMVPFVTAFMHLLAPVAWPVGKLLDLCVGYSHATGHKRTELMTTFALHEKLGSLNERLRSQEVIMVHGALGLRDAKVTSIMAPIQDVFFLSADTVMDTLTISRIKPWGCSRILIHVPGNYHWSILCQAVTQVRPKVQPACSQLRMGAYSYYKREDKSLECSENLSGRQNRYPAIGRKRKKENPGSCDPKGRDQLVASTAKSRSTWREK